MDKREVLIKMRKLADEMLELERYLDGVYNESFRNLEKYQNGKKASRSELLIAGVSVVLACLSLISPMKFNPPLSWLFGLLYPFRWFIIAGAASAVYSFVFLGRKNLASLKEKAEKDMAEKKRRDEAFARHKELEAQLKQLKKELPDHEKYRFFFEIPFEPFYTNYSRTGTWIQAGPLKFTPRQDDIFLEGFDEPVLCPYHEIASCIDQYTIGVYGNIEYIRAHKDEKYIVEKIHHHKALPVRKTETRYSGNRVNVTKQLMEYESCLNGMERTYYQNAGYGFRTSEELHYAGRMSDLAYLESCDIRSERMKSMKASLEAHNDSLRETREVVTGLRHVVFTIGYVIYNRKYQPVLLLLNRYSPVTNIITSLDQHMDYRKYYYHVEKLLEGKVSSVYIDGKYVGAGSDFESLAYIADKYRHILPRFNPLEQPPARMNDKEFRNWIKARHHFCH